MTWRIAREGKLFGPYTVAEVQRYLISGHITPSDLAQPEGGEEWVPVERLFPAAPARAIHPGGLPTLYSDPPDLPWWVALILGALTLGAFFVIWDIVQSAWLRRIDRSSTAVVYYVGVAILYLLKLPHTVRDMQYNFGYGLAPDPSHLATLLFWLGLALLLTSRFLFRKELCRHFNGPEPIGLRLGWIMTLLFGGIYFQYHFNRINEVKRALHVSVPAA
jgi:hypothetical protein